MFFIFDRQVKNLPVNQEERILELKRMIKNAITLFQTIENDVLLDDESNGSHLPTWFNVINAFQDATNNMFTTEQKMSLLFEKFLKLNFGNTYLKECQGLFGVPDYVFYAKQDQELSIISFELKLKDWKRAAKQAFRYKSFQNI